MSAFAWRVATALGAGVVSEHGISGGSISEARRVVLDDGRTVFAKRNDHAASELFEAEAEGLTALAAAVGGPPVPEVLHVESGLLVLEFFPPGSLDAEGWAAFGASLARLHRTSAPSHGFSADNFCGATPQPNPWTVDGVEFFADSRLGYQGELAARKGRIDSALASRINRLRGRLGDLLPKQPPSLIHGDLWSGNVYERFDGVGCLVDPAAHFGFREAELAMTKLFGALPASFYAGYEAEWPLPVGHVERVPLFNLYHVLNHVNLFGDSYVAQAAAIVSRYLD